MDNHYTGAMPHCTAPVLQTGDKESRPVATPTLLHRVTTTIVDFFLPAPLRSEYCVISTTLTNNYYSCLCLFLVLVFAIAEFEQPGWFPRPEELSSAVVGFLGVGAIIFIVVALLEYVETHTWPWEDDGFVWPWEALLWGGTVYNDEEIDQSVMEHPGSFVAQVSPQVGTKKASSSEHEQANNSVADVTASFTTLECVLERQHMIIPPTPFLSSGLRPTNLSPPIRHSSGLLGESPTPPYPERSGIASGRRAANQGIMELFESTQ